MRKTNIIFSLSRYLFAFLFLIFCLSLVRAQSIAVPDGYAGYMGTTGGGNATPVTVSTAEAFKSAVGNDNPAVIIVNGMLNVGTVSIGSNKTIVGFDSTSGLYGGAIKIGGINCIIQNLTFGPHTSGDVMEISGATKIYITKCTFHDSSDELCSIVREADYVTVSWSKFYFDNPTSHSFAHLIGNSDGRTSDRGKLHVTLHHNWYAEGIRGRMPRVRYGHVHIYNNYYNSVGNGYCVGVGYECHIRLENSHFENINGPWADYGGTSNGEMGWDNLIFEGCSQPTFVPNSFPVFSPPYSFNMSPVESVKTIVMEGAGNVFGVNSENAPNVSITSPADSAGFADNSNITIEAEASVKDSGEIASLTFYSDSVLFTDTVAPFSFTWENVKSGIHNIYATATDTNGITGFSKGITLFVGSGVSITSPINGSTISLPANITIKADAWAGEGTIANVEFFQGTTSLGSDNTPPYSFTWNNTPSGTYILTAKATDKDNNIFVSQDITVIVPGGPEGYEFCTSEGGTCTFTGTANVAYGADGKFNYKYNITGSIKCSNDVFGDPIYGTAKSCFIKEVEPVLIENSNVDGLTLYPNPVTDKLIVSLKENSSANTGLTLYNNLGEIILVKTFSGSDHVIDLSALPNGVYIISITGDQRKFIRRIIKN